MTITVALKSHLTGAGAVPLDIGDPVRWSEADAREFLYGLQHLLGTPAVDAQRLLAADDGTLLLEVLGGGSRVTTPPITVSASALAWLERMMFDLRPRRSRDGDA